MNEILAYIGTNRRKVTVGYELNGELVRMFRKIDGADKAAVEDAINEVRNMGVATIVLEVFRPNGNSMILNKKFTLPNDKPVAPQAKRTEAKQLSGTPENTPTLFELPAAKEKVVAKPQSSQPQPSRNMEWKDYALKTEQEKVAKLEAEVRRLSTENRSLDTKVREFEKEMIKKDHEIEKMHGQVERKSGLEGVMERAADNPKVMDFLAGLGSRLFGMPDQQQQPQGSLNAAPDANANPQTEQYIGQIRLWLQRQPMELQEQFYQLVYEITNSKNVSENIIQITNLVKNGTVLKRTA